MYVYMLASNLHTYIHTYTRIFIAHDSSTFFETTQVDFLNKFNMEKSLLHIRTYIHTYPIIYYH